MAGARSARPPPFLEKLHIYGVLTAKISSGRSRKRSQETDATANKTTLITNSIASFQEKNQSFRAIPARSHAFSSLRRPEQLRDLIF